MRIAISSPMLNSKALEYVSECVNTEFLTWRGTFVQEFERGLEAIHNVSSALACSSGSTALHLALLALGVRPGDEVIIPSLTYIATANAVAYCGAKPVLVDVDPDTWCIDPVAVRKALSPKTACCIPVHLYGNVANMQELRRVLPPRVSIVEDAAQAHGVLGLCAFSDVAVFSFYGNKIITCGEGGAVLTNNRRLREQMFHLRGQCVDPQSPYTHTAVGYNYRMSNLQAAVGVAQLEDIDNLKQRRAKIWQQYRNRLEHKVGLQADTNPRAHWMFSIVLRHATQRRKVETALADAGVETRPIFPPLHMQAPYRAKLGHVVAEDLFDRGLNIPTHPRLSLGEVAEVCEIIERSL